MPAQAGQHVSEPSGYQAQGSDGGYRAGTLLGRIGEDGNVFVVGPRFEGHSDRSGKLYLRIVPLAGGNGSTGTYQVKVSTGPGVEVTAQGNFPVPGYSVPTSYGTGATSFPGGRGGRRGAMPPGFTPPGAR